MKVIASIPATSHICKPLSASYTDIADKQENHQGTTLTVLKKLFCKLTKIKWSLEPTPPRRKKRGVFRKAIRVGTKFNKIKNGSRNV